MNFDTVWRLIFCRSGYTSSEEYHYIYIRINVHKHTSVQCFDLWQYLIAESDTRAHIHTHKCTQTNTCTHTNTHTESVLMEVCVSVQTPACCYICPWETPGALQECRSSETCRGTAGWTPRCEPSCEHHNHDLSQRNRKTQKTRERFTHLAYR